MVRLKIVGIGPHPEVIGSEERPGVTSYFSGADTKQWHTRILLQFLPYPRRETLRKPIIVASFWRVEWIVKSTVTSRRLLLAIALGPSPLRTVLRAVRKASHSQEYAFRRERHYSGSFATFRHGPESFRRPTIWPLVPAVSVAWLIFLVCFSEAHPLSRPSIHVRVKSAFFLARRMRRRLDYDAAECRHAEGQLHAGAHCQVGNAESQHESDARCELTFAMLRFRQDVFAKGSSPKSA